MSGSFSVSLKAFEGKTKEHFAKVCRLIALECFTRIIKRSPVDTGRFKANWGASVGSMGGYGSGLSGVFTWNGKGSLYFSNNLPYSVKLEYGHSKQAPTGMVRLTAAEMQGVAEVIAGSIS